jgi:rod shape-determining protein MreC
MLDWIDRHRRKLAAAVAIALPLILLTTSSAGAGVEIGRGAPAQIGRGWLDWTQFGATAVVGGAQTWIEELVGGELHAENERLHREVDRLRSEKSRLIGVLQENERLREMVGFQRRHPEYELVAARVVARDVTPYFRVVSVRLEAAEGIEAGMPVVHHEGVVGRVHQVRDGFADVILVSDPRSRIDAISQRNRAQGVVEGLGHERNYRARLAYLLERDEVRAGDVMVTSGMGGIFPKELVIGTVRELERREQGLFQEAQIEPAVDFSRLEEVYVITGTSR